MYWVLRLKCNMWMWKNIGENYVYQLILYYGFLLSDSINILKLFIFDESGEFLLF